MIGARALAVRMNEHVQRIDAEKRRAGAAGRSPASPSVVKSPIPWSPARGAAHRAAPKRRSGGAARPWRHRPRAARSSARIRRRRAIKAMAADRQFRQRDLALVDRAPVGELTARAASLSARAPGDRAPVLGHDARLDDAPGCRAVEAQRDARSGSPRRRTSAIGRRRALGLLDQPGEAFAQLRLARPPAGARPRAERAWSRRRRSCAACRRPTIPRRCRRLRPARRCRARRARGRASVRRAASIRRGSASRAAAMRARSATASGASSSASSLVSIRTRQRLALARLGQAQRTPAARRD